MNNSASDSSISLKFWTEFEHAILNLIQRFKIKGYVRSQRDLTTAKICYIIDNFVADCPSSVKFALFAAEFDHIGQSISLLANCAK